MEKIELHNHASGNPPAFALRLIEPGIWKTSAKFGKSYMVKASKRINGKRVFKQASVDNLTQARDTKRKLIATCVFRHECPPDSGNWCPVIPATSVQL